MPSEAFAKALDRATHSPLGGDAPGLVHPPLIPRCRGHALAGVAALAIAGLVACSGARPFSTKPVLWEDDDRRPFSPKPEESFVPLYWDERITSSSGRLPGCGCSRPATRRAT